MLIQQHPVLIWIHLRNPDMKTLDITVTNVTTVPQQLIIWTGIRNPNMKE